MRPLELRPVAKPPAPTALHPEVDSPRVVARVLPFASESGHIARLFVVGAGVHLSVSAGASSILYVNRETSCTEAPTPLRSTNSGGIGRSGAGSHASTSASS